MIGFKKSINLLLVFAIISFLVFVFSCSYSEQSRSENTMTGNVFKFEQIGYFKGDNNLRYFTFYINSALQIDRDSISDDLYDTIKEHGSQRMNTSGQITASFYYIDKGNTPDITMLSASKANELAHEMKPIAAVWIMPTGQINLIKNPE